MQEASVREPDERGAGMAQAAAEIVTAPPVGKWELDLGHTMVEFVARHMLTKVRGRFTEFSGTIDIAEDIEDSSVEVEIQAGSVQTNLQMRDDHLKSSDFFEVDAYPTLTFRSTGVRLAGGTDFELDGDLTIRDVTNPITLKGEFLGWGPDMQGTPVLFASARTTVEREDWDLTWNLAVETGGLLVSKKVDLEIEVEAKKVG
jgi:polyisoprenoid-binding protein YceI